jgi:hypothetical protein
VHVKPQGGGHSAPLYLRLLCALSAFSAPPPPHVGGRWRRVVLCDAAWQSEVAAPDTTLAGTSGDVSMVGAALRTLLPRVVALLGAQQVLIRQGAMELLSEFLKQVRGGGGAGSGGACLCLPGRSVAASPCQRS